MPNTERSTPSRARPQPQRPRRSSRSRRLTDPLKRCGRGRRADLRRVRAAHNDEHPTGCEHGPPRPAAHPCSHCSIIETSGLTDTQLLAVPNYCVFNSQSCLEHSANPATISAATGRRATISRFWWSGSRRPCQPGSGSYSGCSETRQWRPPAFSSSARGAALADSPHSTRSQHDRQLPRPQEAPSIRQPPRRIGSEINEPDRDRRGQRSYPGALRSGCPHRPGGRFVSDSNVGRDDTVDVGAGFDPRTGADTRPPDRRMVRHSRGSSPRPARVHRRSTGPRQTRRTCNGPCGPADIRCDRAIHAQYSRKQRSGRTHASKAAIRRTQRRPGQPVKRMSGRRKQPSGTSD